MQVKSTAANVLVSSSGFGHGLAVLNIGVWDMDATDSVDVAHGLNIDDIVSVTAHVQNDAGDQKLNIEGKDEISGIVKGALRVDGTNVSLYRLAGGLFDNADWNDAGINRGYIVILYML